LKQQWAAALSFLFFGSIGRKKQIKSFHTGVSKSTAHTVLLPACLPLQIFLFKLSPCERSQLGNLSKMGIKKFHPPV
jgi:hypothetical protein